MNRLFVENLTVIDFSYADPERGIVGESWIVDIELEGDLDLQGMVFDFGLVKKEIKSLIDERVDHKLLVPEQMDDLFLSEQNGRTDLGFHDTNGFKWVYHSPQSAVLRLDTPRIDAEAVSGFLVTAMEAIVPENVGGISVALRTESIEGAYYHYSHGLKKHAGNCQRIAHGHRSRIEIYINQQRDPQLEAMWAKRFQDIYIGTQEDVVAQGETTEFTYEAPQGRFSLSVPTHRVYLLETDTTVEWIATHIAEKTKKQLPECDVMVRAFEGVGKGAIAER